MVQSPKVCGPDLRRYIAGITSILLLQSQLDELSINSVGQVVYLYGIWLMSEIESIY